jgi:hypothetical protein
MTKPGYQKLTVGLIGVWFSLSLIASALHLLETDPSGPPLALGLAATLPILLFLAWFATSAGFRQFVLDLNPRTLVLVHTWRLVGFTFLVLASYGILPRLFALPAGWGDIAIGATAPFAAIALMNPRRRNSFLLWQALGILDLVLAVGLGAGAHFIDPAAVPTSAMQVLPLSLIPGFAVPLLLILHLMSIAQARHWSESRHRDVPNVVRASAI